MTPADVLAERTYEPFCGNVRVNAIDALGRLGDPSVIPALRRAVEEYEQKHGQTFGLRETLEEALVAAQRSLGR